MSLFGLPNIEKLIENHSVQGLVKALDYREDAGVRLAAARALGAMKSGQAVASLIVALRDVDRGVRNAAVWSLGEIGDPRAREPLVLLLKDAELRREAAEALEKLGWQADAGEGGAFFWIAKCQWQKCTEMGSPAVQPLITALLAEKDFETRNGIMDTLGRTGDTRAIQPLLTLAAQGDDERVKSVALNTLVAMGDQAKEALIQKLIVGEPRVLQATIRALNQIDPNWQDSELAQAALQTVAITKDIRGSVFIEQLNTLSGNVFVGFHSRFHEILAERGIVFAQEKGAARITVRLDWSSMVVGHYASAATANIASCRISIIDNLTEEVITSGEFRSGRPGEQTTQRSGAVYGDIPYAEIQAYFATLAVLPAELVPFVAPADAGQAVRFLDTWDSELAPDPNYLNFRPRDVLVIDSLETTTRDKVFRPRVMLNEAWIVQDTYQSVVEKVMLFLKQKKADIFSQKIGLFATILADLGNDFEARVKGTRFVDPELLPKRVIIRLIPVLRGIRTTVTLGAALGGYLDGGTRKRYEVHFQAWMQALLAALSSSATVAPAEPSYSASDRSSALPAGAVASPERGHKNRGAALALEILLGILGLPGIGWLYCGRKKIGISVLSGFILWDLIAWALVFMTAGISAVCTIPTTFVAVAISALLLNNHMKTREQYGY